MELCERHRNCFVLYNIGKCPACEAEEEIERLKENHKIEIDSLDEQIYDLKKEIKERGESV